MIRPDKEWELNVGSPPHRVLDDTLYALNGLRVSPPLSTQLLKEDPHRFWAPARFCDGVHHGRGSLAAPEVVNVRVLAGHTTRIRKDTW